MKTTAKTTAPKNEGLYRIFVVDLTKNKPIFTADAVAVTAGLVDQNHEKKSFFFANTAPEYMIHAGDAAVERIKEMLNHVKGMVAEDLRAEIDRLFAQIFGEV